MALNPDAVGVAPERLKEICRIFRGTIHSHEAISSIDGVTSLVPKDPLWSAIDDVKKQRDCRLHIFHNCSFEDQYLLYIDYRALIVLVYNPSGTLEHAPFGHRVITTLPLRPEDPPLRRTISYMNWLYVKTPRPEKTS